MLKKEEITEGKIYSPVGMFAERAKLCQRITQISAEVLKI